MHEINSPSPTQPFPFDRLFLFAAISLITLGLLMVASASIAIAEKQFGQPFYFIIRQAIYLLIGLVASIAILRIPIQSWQKYSIHALFLSFFLLVLVLIPGIGRTINGSTRWIHFAGITFQISELVKLLSIIYLAGYLVRHQAAVRQEWIAFIKPLLVLGFIASLLLKEPDFGAAVVILLTAMAMCFLAGVRLRYFIFTLCVIAALIIIIAISSPYRMARLTNFLNPWAHPFSGGYQLTQALIAFGRGGWFGVGLGSSVQKLLYLPEAHSDFLFAVLVEELGLIGGLVVILLFAILIIRGLLIGKRALLYRNYFAAYVAYGCSLWLGIQSVINIGVSAGLLPTKGLTLPLMSAGGSSMIVNCMVIALLLRIDIENR